MRPSIALASLLGLLLARPAAASEPPSVAVLRFDGPTADDVRAAVLRALAGRADIRLVDGSAALGPAYELDRLGVAATVKGTVGRTGRRWTATVEAVHRATEEVAGRFSASSATLGGLPAAVAAGVGKQLLPALVAAPALAARSEPPPEAPLPRPTRRPSPPKEPPAVAQEAPVDAPAGRSLTVSAGVGVLGRSFSYTGDRGGLRPYQLGAAPTLKASALWFPGVLFGALPWLGLELSGEAAVGLGATDESGQRFGSSAYGVQAGLLGRLPLGRVDLDIGVGGGLDGFEFGPGEGGPEPGIPGVSVAYVRIGAEGRAALPYGFSLRLGAGLRPILSAGEIGQDRWFPGAGGFGFDAAAGAALALADGLEVELRADVRRYGLGFDAENADGAEDLRYGLSASLGYNF